MHLALIYISIVKYCLRGFLTGEKFNTNSNI